MYDRFEDKSGLIVPNGDSKSWRNEHILFNPHEREIPLLLIDATTDSVKKDSPLNSLYTILIKKTGGIQMYTLDSRGSKAEEAGD